MLWRSLSLPRLHMRGDATRRCFIIEMLFISSPRSVNFMLRYSDEFISSSLNLRRVDFRETFAIIYYRAVATRQAPIWAPTVRYTIGIRKIIFTVELSSKQARINEDKLIAAAEAIHVNFTFLWGEILKKCRDKSINQPCSSRPENTWNTLWREMGLDGNGPTTKKVSLFVPTKCFFRGKNWFWSLLSRRPYFNTARKARGERETKTSKKALKTIFCVPASFP